LYVKYKKKS